MKFTDLFGPAKHAGSNKHAGSKKHAKAPKHAPAAPPKNLFGPAGSLGGSGGKGKGSAAPPPSLNLFGPAAPAKAHTVGKHPKHPKPSKWTPGAGVACCAAEALAASLRLTGRAVSDQDVLGLYWLTACHEDEGATIEATLQAAADCGLAGVRLLDARPVRELTTGVVFGVDLMERHAAVVDGHGMWSWGQWMPVPCGLLASADEAWELTWS